MSSPPSAPLSYRTIVSTWWPLAASWLLMALELPAVSAAVARLADPEINLAAYGGVVFPLALIVEAPIIMLLAASTALSRDGDSYRLLFRFTAVSAAVLTLVHVAMVGTPVFDWVVREVLEAPPEVRDPARTGLWIMTPWTASIAFRRFQQGVLIRTQRSRWVGLGTVVRLLANFTVLAAGLWTRQWSGIVVATAAVSAGVIAEALFVALAVRPSVRRLKQLPVERVLTWSRLFAFYVPLAMTSLITLLSLPMVSAGLGRMPRPLESLAVWPVMNGLVFALRSVGHSFNEVVVALAEQTQALPRLRRFAAILAAGVSAPLLAMAVTPLGWGWFHTVTGLSPELTGLALTALWFAVLLPALSVWQSWYQGLLVYGERTRGITESVALSVGITVAGLAAGAYLDAFPGLVVGLTALTVGGFAQIAWLRFRVRAWERGISTG